ncbi:hypothetical protein [Microcella flavibacter]|uniref:hypothetical protein n=1 Tax=Microcella flavibacter TaxID=1804990 RepID=UPI001457269B|nr:hypothetical protein [Microcella flavibacter]
MRALALLRAGIACLLLAPVLFVAWIVSPGGEAAIAPGTGSTMTAVMLGWGTAAPILGLLLLLAGGLLNVLAVRAGVRRLERVAAAADRGTLDPAAPAAPRIRILDAQGHEIGGEGEERAARAPADRRVAGGMLAAGLAALAALGLGVLLVGIPQQLAPGIPLGDVYARWGGVGSSGFIVGVVLWGALAVLLALIVAVAGLRRSTALERLLPARRLAVLACVLGSAAVVASGAPAFVVAQELGDVLGLGGATATGAGWAFGQLGIALSAAAILIAVPRWRMPRRAAARPSATV